MLLTEQRDQAVKRGTKKVETMRSKQVRAPLYIGLVFALVGAMGCSEEDPPQQEVLQAPIGVEAVDGEVCLGPVELSDSTIETSPLAACAAGDMGFGLVINQRSARIGVLALGMEQPRMVNMDARRPGVTQIAVGERPIDLAVNAPGNAAVVASQVERRLEVIDLWTLRTMESAIEVEGTPQGIETLWDEERMAVVTGGPNELHLVGSPSCEEPESSVDRRDHDPEQNCQWEEAVEATMELPGRPVALSLDDARRQGWVGYRSRDEVSRVAFDDETLGDDACLDGGDAPCEVERIAWRDNPEEGSGVKSVDVDALGRFVYALDRGRNQLVVIDAAAGEVVDAAIAQEPTTLPFSERFGVPLVRSANALMATVERFEGEEGDEVLYRYGAEVASDNGQLYGVGTLDVACRVEDGIAQGFADGERPTLEEVSESEEAGCLEWPGLPLGADPYEDDQETLVELRFSEPEDGVQVGLTPVFGIRDASTQSSQIVGQLQCDVPDELAQVLSEQGIAEEQWCEMGGMPRPVGPELPADPDFGSIVEDEATEDDRMSPATLLPFGEAQFDDDGEPLVALSPYDRRIDGETWTVTYEGVLPGAGSGDAGLVHRDDGSRFISGGGSFCSAGVDVGDRLTLQVTPEVDEACEGLVGEGAEFLSYEVVESGPSELRIATIEGEETTDELPSRACFPEAVNYQVRAQEAWITRGQSSGFRTPFEAEDGVCVERDDAQYSGRLDVEGSFWGPYLRFDLIGGDVEPVQGLSYNFAVQRNFSRSAESFLPRNEAANLPAQIFETPDLGVGGWIGVADSGGDRIYIRNLVSGDIGAQIVR